MSSNYYRKHFLLSLYKNNALKKIVTTTICLKQFISPGYPHSKCQVLSQVLAVLK